MSATGAMWAPLLFGSALFLNSALLMMVQPMLGKTLLPHLGGNAVAWNACLVFFQATLLAGYVYADLLHRFRGLRWQPWLQLLLMAIAVVLCFVGVFGDRLLVNLVPRLDSFDTWPIVSTMALLIVTIGMPFFLLAAIGPLVQRWFAHLDHPRSSDPYFLFVASNLGGLMGLVVYALMIEPGSPLSAQWMSWKLALTALGVLLFLTALCAWQSPRSPEMEPVEKPSDPSAPLVPKLIGRGPATWGRRWYWFFASAIPVGLMIAATNYLTQDIAPAAIFWAVPLALYLAAFSLEFARFGSLDYGSFPLKVVLHCLYGAVMLGLFVLLIANIMNAPGGDELGGTTLHCVVLFPLILMVPFLWLPVLQPLSALVLVFVHANMYMSDGITLTSPAIVLHLTCYYWSVRLCFGMLARDRPAATALTTYFTWIGIGGLAGGLFTVLFAPVLFRSGYREYAFLTALACTLRPAWFAHGLSDWVVCRAFFSKPKSNPEKPNPWPRRIGMAFDVGVACLIAGVAMGLFSLRSKPNGQPIFRGEFGTRFNDLPLVIALVLAAGLYLRPLRFGLALAAVVAFCFIGMNAHEKVLVRDRNAFGVFRVTEESSRLDHTNGWRELPKTFTERKLMQGTARRGGCVVEPPELLRYPTGYYHRAGPVGQVMRRLEWWKLDGGIVKAKVNQESEFWLRQNRDNVKGDARLAASLIGLGMSPLGGAMAQTAAAWSEPPFAFIGLGVGSFYCYARPFQWVDAYELDPAITALSTDQSPMFHYYQSAQQRGVAGKIIPGDARRNLTKPGREGFYHVLFVDAFNSEAIPTHLLTLEAIEMYFQKLAPEGIVCIHTSNRHVELAGVLDRIAELLNLSIRESQMGNPMPDVGLLESRWIVLARNDWAMQKWVDGNNFVPPRRNIRRFPPSPLWTDEHSSVLSAVRDRGVGWPSLIYGMLIMLLFFGAFLGLIEIVYSMVATSAGKSAVKK